MYISFLKINNFRKFGENDNFIGFVKSHSESPQKDLGKVRISRSFLPKLTR